MTAIIIHAGIQIRTDERGAQIVRPVSNVYAIENEYSIHISDTASDLENTPTHDRKELPTGARTPFSDAEFDYTPLSNKFLAADDFKGSTRSLPPTLPAELSLPQTLRQRSSSNYQLSIGRSPHLTRKLSKYTVSLFVHAWLNHLKGYEMIRYFYRFLPNPSKDRSLM